MKKCKKCSETKTIDSFYKSKGCKDGHHGSCKRCMDKVTQEWDKKYPEAREIRRQTYIKKHGIEPKPKRIRRPKSLSGYRKHLEDKCRRCGFVPEDVCQLTVDHIDKNHSNNEVSNLQTLCGNCHYLKSKVEVGSPEKLKILNLVPSSGT